jgi:membrane-associated phospholipid phosphatase
MVGPLGVDEWVAQHVVRRLPRGNGHAGAEYGWIARMGAPSVVGVTTLLALAWALRQRDLPGGLLAVIGPGLAFVLAEMVIKPLVARRIHAQDLVFVFPSGTVTVVAASVAAIVVLVHRWAGPARALLAAVVLSVLPLISCVAVVALGWHYATDVIGGLAVGGAVVLAVAGLLAAFERRISVKRCTTTHVQP